MFERSMKAAGIAVIVFLVLPLFVVFPLSFSGAQFLSFPPPEYSLRWYREFFSRDYWIGPMLFSVRLALVCAVLATMLGAAAALSLARARYPGRTLLSAFLVSPMVIPFIINAIAFYFVFARVGLIDTFWALLLAHTALALPRVVVVMTSVFQRIDPFLEYAAMTLGARPATAFALVTLPMVLPGIASAAIMAFLASFDEVIVALFLAGPNSTTLPKRMWENLMSEVAPDIAVVSALLVAGVVVLFLAQHAGRGLDWAAMWDRARAKGESAATDVAGSR